MSKKCFMVCPIGSENSPERKRSDDVLNYLVKPVCEELDYEVIRSDKENESNKIDARIIEHLKNDDLIIVDITDHNANVFYELGYRSAIDLPFINIAQVGTKIPFDVVTIDTLYYDTSDLGKANEFKNSLNERIKKIPLYSKETANHEESPLSHEIEKITQSLYELPIYLSKKLDIIDKKNDAIIQSLQTTNEESSTNLMVQLLGSMLLKGMENPEKFKEFFNVLSKMSEMNQDNESDSETSLSSS